MRRAAGRRAGIVVSLFVMLILWTATACADVILPGRENVGFVAVGFAPFLNGLGTLGISFFFFCWAIRRNWHVSKRQMKDFLIIPLFLILLVPALSSVPFLPQINFSNTEMGSAIRMLLLVTVPIICYLLGIDYAFRALVDSTLFCALAVLIYTFNFRIIPSVLERHLFDEAPWWRFALLCGALAAAIAGAKFGVAWLMGHRTAQEYGALRWCSAWSFVFLACLFAWIFGFFNYERVLAIAGEPQKITATLSAIMMSCALLDCMLLDRFLPDNRARNYRLAVDMNMGLFTLLTLFMLVG